MDDQVQQQIKQLRKEYRADGLSEEDVAADPFVQFRIWFDAAVAAGLQEPNGMSVTTCTPDGRPATRILLMKHYDERGFVFFTNYQSRKGREIEANPHGALNFWWVGLERQVRIEGVYEKVSVEESDAYYNSRPRGSRLGAWVSPQSEVIDGREALNARQERYEAQFPDDQPVPRPEHWGGYRLVPHTIEFWQGRPNRLHDRLRYIKESDGVWVIQRLAP